MGLIAEYISLALGNSWLWISAIALALYYIYMKIFISFYDTSTERTDDKVFLITGAETGIGRATVDLLASRGGRIIMACKDVSLGQTARDQIVARTFNENIEVHHLDLSSLESVRKFSKEIHRSTVKLDTLVNNAAISSSSSPKTIDGLNTIMQVNHFGPFLLTNLLLDLVKKADHGRIVFVSSLSHHLHKFCLDNLNCEKEPLPDCRVYFNSKLANILTAKHMARMLQGTGVTVNSVHPGMAKTNLTSSCSGSMCSIPFSIWLTIFGKSTREAAMTSTYVASDPKLKFVTGEHFSECKVSTCVSNIAKDTITQERLFEKSSQLVKLRPEELYL